MSVTAPDERLRHWRLLEVSQSCGQRAFLTWNQYCAEVNQQLAALPDLVASDIRIPRDRVGAKPSSHPLPIWPGEVIPSARLLEAVAGGPQATTTEQFFSGRTVVLFGVPGAFTPTGSGALLSGFAECAPKFAARKVDTVACLAVNDPYVLEAWARSLDLGGRITMLADGAGEFTRLLELEQDFSPLDLGTRCRPFVLIARNGRVRSLAVGAPERPDLTLVEAVLAAL